MTYETQYLEYINTIPSDTFPNLTTIPQGEGKLIFQASSSSGFNGSGTFAQVNFKIIAEAPGSSQLCVLWEVPQETITQTPSPTFSWTTSANSNTNLSWTTSANSTTYIWTK